MEKYYICVHYNLFQYMKAEFTAVNLKEKTVDELRSLKLLLDCKTYDDVIAKLIVCAGYRASLDDISRIRENFPKEVDHSVKKTFDELEARDKGTTVSEEAAKLQNEVIKKHRNLK